MKRTPVGHAPSAHADAPVPGDGIRPRSNRHGPRARLTYVVLRSERRSKAIGSDELGSAGEARVEAPFATAGLRRRRASQLSVTEQLWKWSMISDAIFVFTTSMSEPVATDL